MEGPAASANSPPTISTIPTSSSAYGAMTNALRDASFIDILYTFGVNNPGAVTLRNFPNWMRQDA